MTLMYNLLMFGIDAAVLAGCRRYRKAAHTVAGLAAASFCGGMLALSLAEDGFGMIRLLAYAVFLHGFLLLVITAVLWWKRRRTVGILCVVAAVLLQGVAIQSFLVEPTWLKVSRVTLHSPKLEKPIRIVVLADLQTDRIGEYERRVFREIMDLSPDLVLMPGDYIQESDPTRRRRLFQELQQLMTEQKFQAPLGVYAVAGNVDQKDWPRLFEGLPVTCMTDSRSVDLPGIRITGLSLGDSFNVAMKIRREDRFHIVFGHSPDFALGDVPADLLVAGHTHGGQVQIPFYGPPITLSRIPRAWASGVTQLSGGRTLVVSRGVGMERGNAPRLRFLCRPELVVIDCTGS